MNIGEGPERIIPQNTYVVFYDAANGRPDRYKNEGSVPTCHLCEWGGTNDTLSCDLSTSDYAEDQQYTKGVCFCNNSIYIACNNTNPDDNAVECGDILIDGADSVINACSVCKFNDDMNKTNWNIKFFDAAGGANSSVFIDRVEYNKSNTGEWVVVNDGFSLELVEKGLNNNDYGSSWTQSCSIFGTPGSDPLSHCPETCTTLGRSCGIGGYCDPVKIKCICDEIPGYYPLCNYINQECYECGAIPTISNCTVKWVKDGTYRYAWYSWTDLKQALPINSGYFLNYYYRGDYWL